MMEKSMFDSTIKTYAKRNRFSSIRSSTVYRDDSIFDEMMEQEKNKIPLTVKKSGFERGGVRSSKHYLLSSHNVTFLNNIQNLPSVNRKSSFIQLPKKKKVKTKNRKRNKENTLKYNSCLYKSDTDEDAYSLAGEDPIKKQIPLVAQSTKLTPKSPPSKIDRDINATFNSESKSSKPPIVTPDHSNSCIDRSNPTYVKDETVFKRPATYREGSSEVFRKYSDKKNRYPMKSRRKIDLNENNSPDNEYDFDDLGEYAKNLPPCISDVRQNIVTRRSSFNSVNEYENEIRCSEYFNPGTASTPKHDKSHGIGVTGGNGAKPVDNTSHSPCVSNRHLSNNSIDSRNLENSSINLSEASSQNIHSVIDETQNSTKDDKIENNVHLLNNSSISTSDKDVEQNRTKEEIDSTNDSVSSPSSTSHTNLDCMADISENNSSHDIKCSTSPSALFPFSSNSPENDSLAEFKCKTHPNDVSFVENFASRSNVLVLANSLNSCCLENNQDPSANVDEFTNESKSADQLSSCSLENVQSPSINNEEFASTVSDPTNLLNSSNVERESGKSNNIDESMNDVSIMNTQSYSGSHKDEQDRSETSEPCSVIEDSSAPVQEETTNSTFSVETVEREVTETSLNETAECQPEEQRDSSSNNATTNSEAPLPKNFIIPVSPISLPEEKNTSDTEFAGFSKEEYDHAAERKKHLENIFKPELKFVQPDDEIPAHLKHITRRKKKTEFLPTVNEENSNLEDDEGNLDIHTRNSPIPSRNLSTFSQNLTALQNSRCLERYSMVSHSIVLHAGKKYRRSIILLQNLRESNFQIKAEHENLKGRNWRKNLEGLISSQLNEDLDLKEIGESSTIRTFQNETFLNPNYTCLDSSRRPNKARFSLCVNLKSPAPQQLQSDESSGLTSSSETSKLLGDKSYFSFVGSQQNSRVENNYDLEAGDYSRSCKVSLDCYDIRDHLSAKERVLRYCKQTEPLPFDECFNNRLLQNCKKIGEGVYGEVFMLKRNRAHCSVLKVIPIEGDQLINGERQKKFDEIVSELVISIELSDLRKRKDYYTDNFAELQRCWCVYGKYPKRLIDLWEDYNDSKGSDNDSPKVFDDSQLYIILELSHGGEDVESFVFNNAQQALSVFVQVAYALAVAEQAFNFEHRDLHWGNILVSKTKEKRKRFIIDNIENTVSLRGVKVTIIDYTLSRISINNCIVFNDIGQDPDLFSAQGDFQFEVYRLMRDEVKNVWNQFMPKTNVYWLCYLLDKMIQEVRYRRVDTQIHQTNFERLKEFYELILGFASCHELISHSYFTRTTSVTR